MVMYLLYCLEAERFTMDLVLRDAEFPDGGDDLFVESGGAANIDIALCDVRS
jgi:hypothetical protein